MAKMHQIRFRLGLCPRPRWENSQRSPDHLAEIRGRIGVGKDVGRGKGLEKGGNGEGKGLRRDGSAERSWEGKHKM